MREGAIVLGYTLLLLFLGVGAVFSQFIIPEYYDKVEIKYSKNGSYLKITETYKIVIFSGGHVFYRSFYEEISPWGVEDTPIQIISVNCSIGTPYISYNWKIVDTNNNELRVPFHIALKINNNEVGCFNPAGYKLGDVEVLKVVYTVPMTHVINNNYYHYIFTENHPAIRVLEIYPLNGGKVSYHLIPRNGIVKIDVRTGKGEVPTITEYLILFIILSIIPLLIWYFFGREKKEFVVPKYLHHPPVDPSGKKIDYTLANFLDSGKVDEKSVAAALLRLMYLGIIANMWKGGFIFLKKVYIRYKKDWREYANRMTPFEYDLMLIIDREGILVSIDNECITKEISPEAIGTKIYYDVTEKLTYKYRERIMDNTGNFLIMAYIAAVAILVLCTKLGSILGILSVPYIVALLLSTLGIKYNTFSRFKDGWYKTFLEVQAFKRFLSDIAMLHKYAPGDIVIWKEWLLYATALGVADKVLQVMKEKFPLHQIKPYEDTIHITVFASSVLYQTPSTGGSGACVGVGVGGGFGGGGGGVR